MSFVKSIAIYCDMCSDVWDTDRNEKTVAAVRSALKIEGWASRGDKDYCPLCWAQMQAEKGDPND